MIFNFFFINLFRILKYLFTEAEKYWDNTYRFHRLHLSFKKWTFPPWFLCVYIQNIYSFVIRYKILFTWIRMVATHRRSKMKNDLYSLPLDCASIKFFISHHIWLYFSIWLSRNRIVIIVSPSKKVKRSVNTGTLVPVSHFCKQNKSKWKETLIQSLR